MSLGVDVLVSFCIVGDEDGSDLPDDLEALAQGLAARVRYWEIVLVLGESRRADLDALGGRLAAVTNLRVLIVNDGDNAYRRRRIAASEAIGDVVVISDPAEAASLDLVAFAADALQRGRIVMGSRTRTRAGHALLHAPLRWLSGYRVNARDLRTIALPRTSLTRVLARHTAAIDLRFEAKRAPERYVRRMVDYREASPRLILSRRFDLLLEIVSASGPRFLKGFALLSLAVLAIAALYAVYAVGVVIFRSDIQPGWFTTAMALSGLTIFMTLWASIASLAQARTMEMLQAQRRDDVIDEIGNIAFFARTEALNVALAEPAREAAE